jgi:phage tail sheath protein FI
MNSLRSDFAEWYAAAGYTRGVASYTIDHTTVTLGEIAINALEPRNKGTLGLHFACNIIANFRGSHYLWGNRTAHPLGDANGTDNDLVASHFLNIRQLCATIKKQLYVACRRFTFDPNSDTLWFNFVNAIRPTLDNMKADQGIRDYKILKEYTDKKATLKAKIRIVPIEAVEDFDLTISLEDSFGETTAVVTE